MIPKLSGKHVNQCKPYLLCNSLQSAFQSRLVLTIYSFGSFEILPENAFGTEFIPIPISSDSSDDSDNEYSVENAKRLHHELRQKKRECRALYADMHLVESYANMERERRMALEVHLGCKFFLLLLYQFPDFTINLAICFLFNM
jgi:hypothetical protein